MTTPTIDKLICGTAKVMCSGGGGEGGGDIVKVVVVEYLEVVSMEVLTVLKLRATSRALSNANGYHFDKTLLKQERCTVCL